MQFAVAAVLSAIYEDDLLSFSNDFRQGRGQDDALYGLKTEITSQNVDWTLKANPVSFIGEFDQAWMMRFLERQTGDKRILQLIRGWL